MPSSDSIVVNPTTVNDIEFYVSQDGSYTGMSLSGLARLCGVKRQTIQELLSKFTSAGTDLPESLKALPHKDSWVQVESKK